MIMKGSSTVLFGGDTRDGCAAVLAEGYIVESSPQRWFGLNKNDQVVMICCVAHRFGAAYAAAWSGLSRRV